MRSFVAEESTVPLPLRIRWALLNAVRDKIKTWPDDIEETAFKLNTTQMRVQHLLEKQIDKFSMEALVKMCPRAGINVEYHLDGLE